MDSSPGWHGQEFNGSDQHYPENQLDSQGWRIPLKHGWVSHEQDAQERERGEDDGAFKREQQALARCFCIRSPTDSHLVIFGPEWPV
jgi:hypothetical protein